MKQLTSYNRVAGYLNKVFDLLNAEFFESELSRPTITIQSTPKAYGHFSLREDTWVSKLGGTHEINIGAGTLSRPIEEVAAKFDIPVELITKLIVSVDENKHITRNNKLQKAFDQIISQNWLHYNSIERAFDNED